ncbi:hypothetical protein [Achromobacter sp. AGC25]
MHIAMLLVGVDHHGFHLSLAQTFKTKTEAEVLSGHTAVVWLEGKRGCVAVSHCTPVPV